MVLHPFGIIVTLTNLVAMAALALLFLVGLAAARSRDTLAGLLVAGAALTELGMILGELVARVVLNPVLGPDLYMLALDIWVPARPLGHALAAVLMAVAVARFMRRPE